MPAERHIRTAAIAVTQAIIWYAVRHGWSDEAIAKLGAQVARETIDRTLAPLDGVQALRDEADQIQSAEFDA